MKSQEWRFCLPLFLFNILLLFAKQFVIYQSFKNLSPFKYCMDYLIADFYYLLVIAFFCTINYNAKYKATKWIVNIILLFLILLFYIDIFTVYYFQSHETIISIVSITKFWWNWFTWIWISWIIAFIIILWLCIFICKYKNIQKFAHKFFTPKIFTICFILWVIVYFIQSIIFSIPTSYTRNILSINIQSVNDMANKDLLLTDAKYGDYIKYERWDGKDINIILIFWESLSAVDSYHLWGKNNMPYLDKIQEDGITFNNFVANWVDSCHAHASTLIWTIPFEKYTYDYSFDEWLAEFLNNQWFKTIFISTSPLSFQHQRDFLEKIWFQKIIWEEAFENEEKYSFNAAPDEKLYERTLQEVQNQTWKYFIWLQTISFHGPYNTPLWKTEKLAIQYTDEELYKFYQELKRIGFFNNWILIIVWDHRKRAPAEPWESYIFWETRNYRSIATVVWTWIQPQTINSNIIQHTDIYYSIRKLLWKGDVTMDVFYNDIFSGVMNRTWWISVNSSAVFSVLIWDKYRELYANDVKEKYNDIYRYYLSQKKRLYSKLTSKPL